MNSLIILTNFDFDDLSGAAWSRVLNYSKTLAEEQVETILVSSMYDYSNYFNIKKIEDNIYCIEGIKINFKTTFEDFHFKRYFSFIRNINCRLDDINDKRYFLYNSNLASVFIMLVYLRIFKKQKLYIEKNELRTAIALNMQPQRESLIKTIGVYFFIFIRIFAGMITDLLAVFFSGILVISTRFEKLYKKLNKHVLRIPILIDVNEIDKHLTKRIKNTPNSFKIGYFGWIGEKKDGILSLISVVKKISKKHPVELHLFGPLSKINKKKLNDDLDDKLVYYHGNIPGNDVLKKAIEFDLLSLIRPKNLQTKFGFSTKLGEYLLSGIPVLATSVSDNEIYLKDGVNAFILKVRSKIDQSELENKLFQIIFIYKDYLYEIGYNGRETAINEFYYKNYQEQLRKFFVQEF